MYIAPQKKKIYLEKQIIIDHAHTSKWQEYMVIRAITTTVPTVKDISNVFLIAVVDWG